MSIWNVPIVDVLEIIIGEQCRQDLHLSTVGGHRPGLMINPEDFLPSHRGKSLFETSAAPKSSDKFWVSSSSSLPFGGVGLHEAQDHPLFLAGNSFTQVTLY